MNIKKLTMATFVASSMATASFAGTIEVMEDDTMVADPVPAGTSGGGIVIPLVALAIVAALIAADDS